MSNLDDQKFTVPDFGFSTVHNFFVSDGKVASLMVDDVKFVPEAYCKQLILEAEQEVIVRELSWCLRNPPKSIAKRLDELEGTN